jgi:serine/threonine protein phosphatase PrpC
VKAFGLSETGPVRHMNEDCFVSAEDLRLFVVADGMGGHAAGEVAARVAVESIQNFIRRSHETTDFSWPYGIDPTLSYEANRLKTAVSLANRRINRLAEDHDDYLGMGTTVVCALLSDGHLIAAHVGDSRLYVCDENGLVQLTQDDSWAATVLGSKEAGNGPHATRHVLTNVLGARPDTQVHLLERALAGNETLLLCSDGLHGSVPHDALRDVMASHQELPALAQALVRTALEHGSRDNITALVVRCSGKQASG